MPRKVPAADFANEYVKDHNATKAALRCGAPPGCAKQRGSELLSRRDVKEELASLTEKAGITAIAVLKEIALLAFSNVDNYDIEGLKVIPAEGVDPNVMKAVSSVKRRTHLNREGDVAGEEVEFKLWSKPDSLKMLATHLSLLVDKLEVSAKDDILKALSEAANRNRKPQPK